MIPWGTGTIGISRLGGWGADKNESAKKQKDHCVIRWSKKGGVKREAFGWLLGFFAKRGTLRTQLSAKKT